MTPTPQTDAMDVPVGSDKFANDDPNWWAWHPSHWEDAGEGSIRPAVSVTRGQAAANFARDCDGDITHVRVWKRYAIALSYRYVWQEYGYDAWEDRFADEYADAHDGRGPDDDGVACPPMPADPPPDWEPSEYHPVWCFVHRSHPNAIPIWVCGVEGDEPPTNPRKGTVGR